MSVTSNSSFILSNFPDPSDTLPNARILETSGGLTLQDSGGGNPLTVTTQGNLATLNAFTTPGFVVYNTGTSNVIANTLTSDATITITNPTGQGGTTNFAVNSNTMHQLVDVQVNGVTGATRSRLNFISAGNTSISVTDSGSAATINVGLNVESAPSTSKYIIQEPDGALPNAQPLSALSTGLMKVTTATGVVSTAIPANTSSANDYQPGSTILSSIAGITPTIGTILVGNGTSFTTVLPADAGDVLTCNGPGVEPSWQPPTPGESAVVVLPNPTMTQVLTDGITYIPTNVGSGAVEFSLPASPNIGDVYHITGFGDEGWTVSQHASQTIKVGTLSTTAGTGGSIAATFPTDSIVIYCITSTQFVGIPYSGQVSIV
jgi:hypothetical protein